MHLHGHLHGTHSTSKFFVRNTGSLISFTFMLFNYATSSSVYAIVVTFHTFLSCACDVEVKIDNSSLCCYSTCHRIAGGSIILSTFNINILSLREWFGQCGSV